MKKFQVICADPAWRFNDKLKMSDTKRSADDNYMTMSMNDIIELPVRQIADPAGCVLCLWTPASMLQDGLNVASAWGFKQKQIYTWVKTTTNGKLAFGMGRLFRNCTEHALVCTSGKSVYSELESNSERCVDLDVNMRHSQKPEALQDKLERMFPHVNKIELFARRPRDGWTCVGNEIDGRDIRDVLREMCDDTTTS